MKLLYVVNTRHDADAYRVYTRVHMDGRVTMVNQIVSLVAGLLITAGGALAVVQQGPKVLYIASVIVGLLVLARPVMGLLGGYSGENLDLAGVPMPTWITHRLKKIADGLIKEEDKHDET